MDGPWKCKLRQHARDCGYLKCRYRIVGGCTSKISGTLSSGTDITEQRRAEGEREALLAQLHQAQKMEAVGNLAGGVVMGERTLVTLTECQIIGNRGIPLLTGDIVDAHSYGDAEFLRKSPFFEPNFLTWIAAAQIAGTPTTVTEWAVPWPARFHLDYDLLITPTMELDMAEAAAVVDRIEAWNDGLGNEWREVLPGALAGSGHHNEKVMASAAHPADTTSRTIARNEIIFKL